MEIYKRVVDPLLNKFDSETMHVAARESLHLAEILPFGLITTELIANRGGRRFTDTRLKVVLSGIEFDNPVMVGAGWDKVGKAVEALYRLGFSGVEVGSVLRYPQPGNDKPRQFMVGPGVALNSLGFNTPGMYEVANNLKKYKKSGIPIGVSIGLNKWIPHLEAPQMYAQVANTLYSYANYFAINVSSPNTPGLRALQDKGPLIDIIKAVQSVQDSKGERKPIFIKISPDLNITDIDDVISVVLDNSLAGMIVANTTNNVDIKTKYGMANKTGGISGSDPEYRKMTTREIAHIHRVTNGEVDIIGVGGINSTDAALEKLKAGARLLQVVTAIRELGPSAANQINRGIAQYMDREGIKNLKEIVGISSNEF